MYYFHILSHTHAYSIYWASLKLLIGYFSVIQSRLGVTFKRSVNLAFLEVILPNKSFGF